MFVSEHFYSIVLNRTPSSAVIRLVMMMMMMMMMILLLIKILRVVLMTRAHSFLRQNLTNSAANLVNSAAYRGKADEIPRFTAATQLNFRGLIKS